jgi:hypothetical protein
VFFDVELFAVDAFPDKNDPGCRRRIRQTVQCPLDGSEIPFPGSIHNDLPGFRLCLYRNRKKQ